MLGGSITVRPKIRYILSGVYFQRSDCFFNLGFRGNEPLLLTHLGVDPLNSINAFENNFFESFSGYGPIFSFQGTIYRLWVLICLINLIFQLILYSSLSPYQSHRWEK